MNAIPTRTYNPLPFTDLEPKRFEDLVRQLTYDFRQWRRLEATGRSGSDDGFDARGYEIVPSDEPIGTDDSDEAEAAGETAIADRLWLIQCKRERTITPAKLKRHLDEIVLDPEEKIHGIIFAAACDFSKTARDAFLSWCRDHGINEAYIWGKGELEDQLYQPKNDNLLFAYFGISLTIRRRSQTALIRAEIATKRKLKKTILMSSAEILVRDPIADGYPDVPKGKNPDKWWVYVPEELSHYGLRLSIYWHHAYIDPDTGAWDAADATHVTHADNPWRVVNKEKEELEELASEAWAQLAPKNKAWLKVSGYVPLRNIVAIDEMGDDIFEGTHLYASFNSRSGPFDGFFGRIEPVSQEISYKIGEWVYPEPEKRIKIFPPKTRKLQESSATGDTA